MDRLAKGMWVLSLTFAVLWLVSAFMAPAHSQDALRYFDAAHLDRADARAFRGYLASGLNTLVVFGLLWVLQKRVVVSGMFKGKVSAAGALWMGVLLGLSVSVLLALVTLPLRIYGGFILERQFGLSSASFGVWFTDYLKNAALNGFTYAVAGGAVAWCLVKLPKSWPWVLAVGYVLTSVFIAFIYPTVIAPFFDKFYPLQDQEILSDIRALTDKAGMEVGEVLVMEASAKTSRANAYFAGVGASKQVVLYDTLLNTHTREQVKLVVAHEMGHWKYGHVSKNLVFSALGVTVVLLALSLSIGRMPPSSYGSLERSLLVLLVVSTLAGYVFSPVSSFISRRFEAASDAYSLELTGDPATFVSTQINLSRGNLSDVDPPLFIRWFAWTHPTTLERIRMAQKWGLPQEGRQ
ncbi:MAG TPA: M48 family metallopeptidase [Firmicutes bacterium]|nr:M48 family metallopeptidase [Candidatus Fermentithermobacillaceae bacterium]